MLITWLLFKGYIIIHPVNKIQAQTYKQLHALSHFYDQLTDDLVITKNRLHQALQSTFPEIENLFSNPKGKNYWQIVTLLSSL